MLAYHLARFSIDATPPIGHPLCGGWIKPAEAIDDLRVPAASPVHVVGLDRGGRPDYHNMRL